MNNNIIKNLIIKAIANRLEVDSVESAFCESIKKVEVNNFVNNLKVKIKKNIKIPKLKKGYYTVFTVNGKDSVVSFVLDKIGNNAYNENLFRCHKHISNMENLAKSNINPDIEGYYVVFISGNEATRSKPPHTQSDVTFMDEEDLRFINGTIHEAKTYKHRKKNIEIEYEEVTLENSYYIEWHDIENDENYKFVLFEI